MRSQRNIYGLGLVLVAAFCAVQASAHEIEDRSLALAEENYLCTYEGSVRIDTGLEAEISLENDTNPWIAGQGHRIYIVDHPGGAGLVPEGAETGELREYSSFTRRLSGHDDLQQAGETTIIASHSFSDGPGGNSILIRKDVGRYRTRHDFGGRTGTFKSMDNFGVCERFTSANELPQTVAMKKGLSGQEAERFIDDWERKSREEANATTRRIMAEAGYSEAEIEEALEGLDQR